jgi:hypothetical protein
MGLLSFAQRARGLGREREFGSEGALLARPSDPATGPPDGGRAENCGILDLEKGGKMPGKRFGAEQIVPKLRGRGGLGQGVDGGAGRPLFFAGESRFAGFDDVNNSVIAAFGTRNATLSREWEDAHGNARVCACSRLEATPAIVISRQSVGFRACIPARGIGLFAECDGFELAETRSDRLKPLYRRISHLEALNLEETDS